MQYEVNPDLFKFPKPREWASMPMFKKIAYYKTQLNQYYAPYVDKLTAKKIVLDLCGDKIKVANVVRILSGPDDLQKTDLNVNNMIKATHGSGWNINMTSATNLQNTRRLLHSWNRHYTEHNEKQYLYIKPQFFIEAKVNDKYGGKMGEAAVFAIRCIHGEPVCLNIKLSNKFNKYDIEFNLLEPPQFIFERPVELDRMMELSRILSKLFEFVRIDFYIDKNSDLYFSEFTFTPNAGNQFYKSSIEERFGALWK
jgi:hypothetical protein